MTTAYLAAEGLGAQLREELRRADIVVAAEHGRLLITEAPAIRSAWSANIWHDCIEWPVESIGSAAKALRGLQRNWAMYAPVHHRRAALIQEKLPHVSAKPIVFPAAAPTAPLGSWTLLAPDRMLAAADCSSPFPNGEVTLVEPGRAEAVGADGRVDPIAHGRHLYVRVRPDAPVRMLQSFRSLG